MDNTKELQGKTFLITGGTGSFGNTVVKRLLKAGPKKVVILSRDEKKQFDMRNIYNDPVLKFVIGDVRDRESVDKIMRDSKPDYVFHAAALKQVPTCEFFPMEAIKTNIIGTYNVIESAIDYEVQRVVILSTDKAAYPINAMGMSKAMMEKIMMASSKRIGDTGRKTILCGTRYGNVLYSRGSVIPFFQEKMTEGVKLPVTDYRMTRFLLPLESAVDLVMYALANGQNGHMYIKKAPATSIKTLAEAMCQMFNYEPGFEEVGIRSGEKMHETLVTQEEMARARDVGDYYEIPPESQNLDYNQYFFEGKDRDFDQITAYTSGNTAQLSTAETIELLKTLPEIKAALAGS